MGLTASGFAQERQRPLQERLNECFLKKQLMHLPHRNAGLADAGEHFGDIPLQLKENLPVAWYLEVYDHLDDKCKALLGGTRSNGTRAVHRCTWLLQAMTGFMATCIQYSTGHNLRLSIRYQDWAIKVDYRDCAGTGNVVCVWARMEVSRSQTGLIPVLGARIDTMQASKRTALLRSSTTATPQCLRRPATIVGRHCLSAPAYLMASLIVNWDLGVDSFAPGSAQLLRISEDRFKPGHIS
jgi:hypothetical protein